MQKHNNPNSCHYVETNKYRNVHVVYVILQT